MNQSSRMTEGKKNSLPSTKSNHFQLDKQPVKTKQKALKKLIYWQGHDYHNLSITRVIKHYKSLNFLSFEFNIGELERREQVVSA